MKYNEGTFKYMLKKIISALASIIGGLLVFLCVYWLFRLDTWTERGIYIGASIFLSLILIKILSFFNDEQTAGKNRECLTPILTGCQISKACPADTLYRRTGSTIIRQWQESNPHRENHVDNSVRVSFVVVLINGQKQL